MKMLYCRKCGTAIISDETLIQSVLDQMADAKQRVSKASGIEKTKLIHEVSEYKSIYRALMHCITQREYAEAVAPYILHALVETIKARKLMTEAEIAQIYDDGREKAKKASERLRKQEKEIYGTFESISNYTKPDPTANTAIAAVDRESRRNPK